jgi:hypothetical protein
MEQLWRRAGAAGGNEMQIQTSVQDLLSLQTAASACPPGAAKSAW